MVWISFTSWIVIALKKYIRKFSTNSIENYWDEVVSCVKQLVDIILWTAYCDALGRFLIYYNEYLNTDNTSFNLKLVFIYVYGRSHFIRVFIRVSVGRTRTSTHEQSRSSECYGSSHSGSLRPRPHRSNDSDATATVVPCFHRKTCVTPIEVWHHNACGVRQKLILRPLDVSGKWWSLVETNLLSFRGSFFDTGSTKVTRNSLLLSSGVALATLWLATTIQFASVLRQHCTRKGRVRSSRTGADSGAYVTSK